MMTTSLKLRWWLLSIILFSLAARIVFFGQLPTGTPFDGWELNYTEALRHHFFEYLAYTPRKPPLYSVFHGPIVWLFSDDVIARYRLFSMQLWCFDALAMAFLLALAVRLGAMPLVAWLILATYSLCLMPIELLGINYDAGFVLFSAIYMLALLQAGHRPSFRSMLAVSAAGALLIAQSTISSLLVPAMTIVVVAMAGWTAGWRVIARHLATALVLPVVMLALLVGKNLSHSGIAATANGAGHTNILFVMMVNNWDVETNRQTIVEAGAPNWYLWCYDHPVAMDKTPGAIYARSWAHCGVRPGDGTYDMSGLLQAMTDLGEDRMAEIVRQDMEMFASRPWLVGHYGWTATRWFAEYSKVNVAVGRHFFRQDPGRWLRMSKLLHDGIWIRHGPGSLGDYIRQFWSTSLGPVPAEPVMKQANRVLAGLVRNAYGLLPWIIAVLAASALLPWMFRCSGERLRRIPLLWLTWTIHAAIDAVMCGQKLDAARNIQDRWNRRELALKFKSNLDTWIGWTILIIPILIGISIFCGTVGTENERFFQQILPFLVCIAAIVLSFLLKFCIGLAGLLKDQGDRPLVARSGERQG